MIQRTLAILLLSLATSGMAQAQPDSLLVANIVGGIPVVLYSEADFSCALESVFGTGTDISDAGIEPFGSGWALVGSGVQGSNGLDAAFRLTQHGAQLWLRAAAMWDRCDGVQCSSCKILLDPEGDGYCDCKKKIVTSGYCNHSTGSGGVSGLIGAIQLCAM